MSKDKLVGTRIREYEIIETIGQGGMGTVYKARHIYLQKERAVKVIKSVHADDQTLTDRFIREAKILSELSHPNLVQLYEFGRLDEDTFFMVMEFVQGESVLQRMRRVGKIRTDESIRIIRQTALGLGSAHKKGIIHRDISPDNLLLVYDESGNEIVKVIDFGIARPLVEGAERYTATNVFLGKPQYCSPEQTGILEGGTTVDQRSDIYSLAITFYYLLVGKLPFDSPTPIGYLVKHATEPPRPILTQDMTERIPAALDRLILKALSKNPDSRHHSMDEFISELDTVIASRRKALAEISGDDQIMQLFEKGKKDYEERQWIKAITTWQQALELSPENDSLKQWIALAERERAAESQIQHVPVQTLPPTIQTSAGTPPRKWIWVAFPGVLLLIALCTWLFLRNTADDKKRPVIPVAQITLDLMNAVTAKDIDKIKSLIQSGTPVNGRDKSGETPLVIAAKTDRNDIVRTLLEGGADVNLRNGNDETPLMHAALNSQIDNVQTLLDAKADPNAAVSKSGTTPLMKVLESYYGDEDSHQTIVDMLIKAGADVNQKDKDGETVLHKAASKDQHAVLKTLIDAKADVKARNKNDATPLMVACSFSRVYNIQPLLKAGADVNAVAGRSKTTAMMNAIDSYHGNADTHQEIVDMLIKGGADVNQKDHDGNTALHKVARKDQSPVLQILIDAKADVNARNKEEETPLMVACVHSMVENVKVLLKASADVNAQSRSKKTALMQATDTYNGNATTRQQIAELLRKAGARE